MAHVEVITQNKLGTYKATKKYSKVLAERDLSKMTYKQTEQMKNKQKVIAKLLRHIMAHNLDVFTLLCPFCCCKRNT